MSDLTLFRRGPFRESIWIDLKNGWAEEEEEDCDHNNADQVDDEPGFDHVDNSDAPAGKNDGVRWSGDRPY